MLTSLAACQPLPQPFKPDGRAKADNALVQPIGETSLFIPPVAGLPPMAGAALADALASALAEHEIPASDNARSVLSSVLIVSLEPQGGDAIWRWSKRVPDNGSRNGEAQLLGIGIERLAAGEPAALQQAAKTIAAVLAATLNEDRTGTGQAAVAAQLAVLACDGAPGDGNRSLRQAMREILILVGQPPVADAAAADYLISCNIRVWQDSPKSEQVAIHWTLLAADGRQLGEVKQANRIPKGQLDSAWGRTAHIIAQGGWQGLSQILEAQGRPGLVRPHLTR